jgi:multidrug efflux pump subunit AcrA (membrane-fusion protein)
VTEEYIMREIDQVKKARQALEADLAGLQRQREQLQKLDSLSESVRSFCSHVGERLAQLNFEEKRLALEAPQIRVVVNGSAAKLLRANFVNLATIERTWA